MNLLVIGASRGVGAELVRMAGDEGHRVTALVRDPGKMKGAPEGIRVVKGDIRDKGSVSGTVSGQDAVSITIGIGPTLKPVTVFSKGTKTVIEAMKREHVSKLVCVTGIGAGDSRGHGGFFYDRIVFPLLLKNIYEDKDIQESAVRESGLKWVIVRPGFLTNGPVTGRYRVITDMRGVRCGRISRGDVAHFILGELRDMKYAGQTPLLTY